MSSTNPHANRRPRWLGPGIIGVVAIGLVAGVASSRLRQQSAVADPPRTPAAGIAVTDQAAPSRALAPGQAGVVGDLNVTQEAMELAEIRVEPVKRQVVPESLAASGVIEAGGDRVAKVTARVGGKVSRVLVVAGDRVRAGQTLALIESAELAQAQASYRQATARAGVARVSLDRQRKLASLGAFGGPKVEDARLQSAATEGDANVARGEVAEARHDVTDARGNQAALQAEVAGAQSDVATAESEVTEARGQVKALQAALVQAQAQAKASKTRLGRADLLLKEQLISRQEWEQTQADHQRAEADVEAARANVGQGTAKLDATKARLRTAEAKVGAARERVQQAAARIETALARQAQAEARSAAAAKRGEIGAQALAREEAVYKGGYGVSKEIVEAEAALQQADLAVEAAAQAVRLFGGSPGGSSVVAVTAPISGRIQERSVTLGETVDTEHPLFTVVDLDLVWAQLSVAPRDLPRVRIGQRVDLTAESAPGKVFAGKVSATATTADETTRAVAVRVSLANPSTLLRPGAFVRGSIVLDVRHQQIVVPKAAIQEHTGRKTLYVALEKPGAFEVRHVTLGASGEEWREVTAGLDGTDRVAVNGTYYLKSEALKSQLSDGCCASDAGKE